MQRLDPKRAIEITSPGYGSGYRIGGRLVLTASHLFKDNSSQSPKIGTLCTVRSKSDFGEVEAKLVWVAPQADAALIVLPDNVPRAKAVEFGFLPQKPQAKTISFELYGWPLWARTKRFGEKPKSGGRHITGKIYLADTSPEKLLVVEPERLPEAPIPGEKGSQWEGISGAAVICNGLIVAIQRHHQNPDRPASLEAQPLTAIYNDEDWRILLKKHGINSRPKKVPIKLFTEPRLSLIATTGVTTLVTLFVFLVRWGGLIQSTELLAYDLLLSARPHLDEHDKHVAVLGIEIDEPEISDQQLQDLLVELNSPESRPSVIGLDIYRDHDRINDKLRDFLKSQGNQNIISACLLSRKASQDGQPPFLLKPEEIEQRDDKLNPLGFADVVIDLDEKVRRHTITFSEEEIEELQGEIVSEEEALLCRTPVSLSMRISQKYLAAEGIEPESAGPNSIRLGEVILHRLPERAGGYQRRNDGNSLLAGTQLMLNYRPLTKYQRSSFNIRRYGSEEISKLSSSDLSLFKDKVVLIGYTSLDLARNKEDLYRTPRGYEGLGGSNNPGTPEYGRIPGVIIHAHMTSQIINAVFKDRPLIWVLSEWRSFQWTFIWTLIFGFLVSLYPESWQRFLIFAGVNAFLITICYLTLSFFGGWFPLVPPLLTVITMFFIAWMYSQVKKEF